MTLEMFCAKGCGGLITVTDEVIELAKKNHTPLSVEHETCPGAVTVVNKARRFRASIVLEEVFNFQDPDTGQPAVEETWRKEVIANTGFTVDAPSLTDAMQELADGLTKQWGRFVQLAPTLDSAS